MRPIETSSSQSNSLPPRATNVRKAAPSASFLTRAVTLVAVVLPFLGVVVAGYMLWGEGFSWFALALLISTYVATALGITVGYHRLFTHRSFETSRTVQAVFGALGSMAVQGPLILWVAQHRLHHKESDLADDPHSPHTHGRGLVGIVRGLWHSHVGWLFQGDAPSLKSYVPDLMKNNVARQISRLFPLWVALSLLIPTAAGWAVSGTWYGAMMGLIWGGLVRIFFVHHVTWSINSICHLWGSQPYDSGDRSKNNFVFGVLAMGEGWHNNHHAFPTSARHGLAWWQIDVSYAVIRLLSLVGLAWNIKVASPQLVKGRRRHRLR